MADRRSGEGGFGFSGDLRHHRVLVQDIQHPVPGGEGILQSAAQRRQGHCRTEGGEQRQRGDQYAVKAHRPTAVQPGGDEQHPKVEQQDDGVGDGRTPACRALEPLLVDGERIRPGVHLRQTLLALAELNGLRQAPQTVQDETAQFA